MVPEATVIPRSGTVRFQASVLNHSELSGNIHFATSVIMPDGNIYPRGYWLDGPSWLHLDPYGNVSGTLSQTVSNTAPLGTYTYRGYAGLLGPRIVFSGCQFQFEVVE